MSERLARMTMDRIILLILIGTLAGCAVGPDYHRPATTMPAAFGTYAEQHKPPVATTQPVVLGWWKTFDDRELDSLIQRAVESNLDLKLAAARLLEARARRAVAMGGNYPQINATAGYSHQRTSQNTQPFASAASAGFPFPFEYDFYQLGFDASWELDIFGHQRRVNEAANADLDASIASSHAVLISVMAEVAVNYADLRGAQAEMRVARQNLASERQTVQLTKNQQQQGLATDLDVSRAVAQAAATESKIPQLDKRQWQSIHRLAILLGRQPNDLAAELKPDGKVPVAPNRIALGLPAQLLLRRPDIRVAERKLAAATARIGAAKADMFPKLSLVGALGLQSAQTNSLGDWSSRYFNAGPSISWPIFDFGRLKAQLHVRTAQQQEAFVVYQQTVLKALREVEDAIVALQTERDRTDSLLRAQRANARAAETALDLYQRGLTDFLSVLDAQRSLYASQQEVVKSQTVVTTDAIALYKALGGQ